MVYWARLESDGRKWPPSRREFALKPLVALSLYRALMKPNRFGSSMRTFTALALGIVMGAVGLFVLLSNQDSTSDTLKLPRTPDLRVEAIPSDLARGQATALRVINSGDETISILDININDRPECTTPPPPWYSSKNLTDQQIHKLWFHQIDPKVMGAMSGENRDSKGVIILNTQRDSDFSNILDSAGSIILKIGDGQGWRLWGCNNIIKATIDTDHGSATFRFGN
jgi:hypothetical protein